MTIVKGNSKFQSSIGPFIPKTSVFYKSLFGDLLFRLFYHIRGVIRKFHASSACDCQGTKIL